MNNQTREIFLKKYKEEKAVLEKLKKIYEDDISGVHSKENLNSFDLEYTRISQMLEDPSTLLSAVIDSTTSGNKPEVKCNHEIIYPYFGDDRYKCLDCDTRIYEPNKSKLANKRVLSYRMMSRRHDYLQLLLDMPSEEAVMELQKTYGK